MFLSGKIVSVIDGKIMVIELQDGKQIFLPTDDFEYICGQEVTIGLEAH